jgi:hypothetical protein
MTGFDSKRQMAANKLQEIFCGVDYADGVLAVSVMRRSPDGVAELLHSEQIELAQPAQDHVGMLHIERLDQWLDASLKERKQREWVGLTEKTVLNMMPNTIPTKYDGPLMEFAKAVEKALQEKNT